MIGRFAKDNRGNCRSLVVTSKTLQTKEIEGKALERATRIELAFSAWEADVLPLNYARVGYIVVGFWGVQFPIESG